MPINYFGGCMAHSYYPMLTSREKEETLEVVSAARIACYDDKATSPHVILIDPQPIRDYLEEITQVVFSEAQKMGGKIPFSIIRECVENFIHAYFKEPVISILDAGATIKFSDMGPGIKEKEKAKEFGTSSATAEMKKYIRGTGSGFPYIIEYISQKGGFFSIEDNLQQGCVVTLSLKDKNKKVSQSIYSTREKQALELLYKKKQVGPKALFEAYGGSLPTWSRCLQTLQKKGILKKGSQKYEFTPSGVEEYLLIFPAK